MQAHSANAAAADVVNRDSAIPGLGLLLDPARLIDSLSGQLDSSLVDDIKLVYLRYKPGINCLARYELCVNGKSICAYAKAHGQDAAGKLAKAMERPVIDGSLGPGRVALSDNQVIFSTFPNDAKLGSLLRLGEPADRQRLFKRVFGQDSKWRSSELEEVLNYKPERRYVVRVKRDDGQSALIKFYTQSGFCKTRTISRQLNFNHHEHYQQIIGQSKKHALIAYRWQPGSTLRTLSANGRLAVSDIAATARLLANFHSTSSSRLPAADMTEQVAHLSALGGQAGFLLPHLHNSLQQTSMELARWLNDQVAVNKPLHGDFYDKQVVVHDHVASLIDLDGACLGNPLMDLGTYLAHLERHAISEATNGSAHRMQKQVLVNTYEQSTGSVNVDQLSKYTALGLFRLIHHPFRDWAEDWPVQTEQLLDRVNILFSA